MKKIFKKYWKSILLFIIIGLFLIPFFIHLVFKINACCDFFIAEWTAGDVLAFYGVLLGATATIWGVYLSIQFSQANYQEDTKKRVLPFIALTKLKVKLKYSPFAIQDISKPKVAHNEYEEVPIDKVYFILKDNTIEAKTALTEKEEEIIHHAGFTWENTAENKQQLVETNYLSFPMHLENVGNGVANLFRLGFNSLAEKEAEWKYVTPMPLKVGQILYVHIYCDDVQSCQGNYALDFVYEDIYKNKYHQRHKIQVTIENNKTYLSLDFNGNQECINN